EHPPGGAAVPARPGRRHLAGGRRRRRPGRGRLHRARLRGEQRARPGLAGAGAGQRPVVEDWVELAARAEWKTLDRIYALLGDTAGSVLSVREAFRAARLTHRLVHGRADAADLLALRRAPGGEALLAQHRARVRSLLLAADLEDPQLQAALTELLPES